MNNKKGISLIVLVITILVMIILAGVVIVSLQNDNPINKAKYAKMVDSVQSVRAAISQYAVAAQANETTSSTYAQKVESILTGLTGEGATRKGTLKAGTAEGLNSKTVKDILGVDPTTVQAYGDFIVYVETGRSEFEVNKTGAALKGDNTFPDGIVDNVSNE